MEVNAVQGGQQTSALDNPADQPSDADIQAAFAQVVGSITLSMVLRQTGFTKQTVTEAFNDE